jgi:hypothetical protein
MIAWYGERGELRFVLSQVPKAGTWGTQFRAN